MEHLERFKENLTSLLGEENFEQFQDFFRVKSIGRDLSIALASLGLVFICLTSLFISSLKPFKSKNRDQIDLDATNQNLKKVLIEIFERQPNL